MINRQIEVPQEVDLASLFGNFDENVKMLDKALSVNIASRDNALRVTGEEENVEKASQVINMLMQIIARGEIIDQQKVLYAITMVQENGGIDIKMMGDDCIAISAKGHPIKTKTLGQKKYVDAIDKNTIVFGIGPAGTGKTYLAVAKAVTALRSKEVSRIILTRPAVEAGEKLGFLPGDLQNKVDPYLRPLYDGMYEMLGGEGFLKYQEKGVIEVAPLAYMRGRTLDNAFIILDEAQNTTPEQMKMFLTRIGYGSKAIVTGDITQIDLPGDRRSGLKEAAKILKNIENEQDKEELTPEIEKAIKDVCVAVMEEEECDFDAEISVTLVDNDTIRSINKEQRDIDRATDVLSFPMLEFDEDGISDDEYDMDGELVMLGDIVISMERAREQANEFGHSFLREVAFLTAHSMLHLLGYDHVDDKEGEEIMCEKQERVLTSLGITRD